MIGIQFCISDIDEVNSVVRQNISDLNTLNLGNKQFSIFAMNISSVSAILMNC